VNAICARAHGTGFTANIETDDISRIVRRRARAGITRYG
jgi:hypothetical protein